MDLACAPRRRRAAWALASYSYSSQPHRWPSAQQRSWSWIDKWEAKSLEHEHEMDKAYKCGACGVGNWMSRPFCRVCKTKWACVDWDDKSKKSSSSNAQNRDENVAKMEALQKVVDDMDENPALADMKQKINGDIAALKKKTTDKKVLCATACFHRALGGARGAEDREAGGRRRAGRA